MDFKVEPLPNQNIVVQPPKQSVFKLIKNKYVILGFGLLVLIVFIIFYLGRGSFSESSVQLKIDGPSEITGGDLITYKITFGNNNQVPLSDVRLNILYPQDSIVVKDGNIVDLTAENFDIGSVGKKETGERELSAYIVGDNGNIKNIKATLTYKAGNLSSVFQKEVSLATTITNLSVPITLVAAPTAISGQSADYLIDYRNQSNQDLENLRFIVKYPQGFSPIKLSPDSSARSSSQLTWDVPQLKQGDGARITIQGILTGSERESKTISVILQKKITTPTGDVYVDFEKSEATSVISTPPLAINMNINDSNDYVAHLGDTLRYKINFQNNNNEDISGLSLSVHLDGNMYDLSTVKSDGFFDSRLNTITWNASNVPALNILQANQSGIVNFEVHLKNSFSGGLGAGDSFVKASAHLETSNVPASLNLDKLSADNELVTRISTAPTFGQKIFVNDPVFGSNGPFPPKVNQKTAFTIYWNIVNPSNDISQTKVTATLAPGVNWENRVRVSGTQVQPSYDSRTNTLTWDLGTLPLGIGVSFPAYEAFYQISITPSVNQVDQQVPLLKNVHFDGVDSFTKEKISRTIPDTGTNNISDNNSGGAVQR